MTRLDETTDLDQILEHEGWFPIVTADRATNVRLNHRTPQGTPIGTVGSWTGVAWREHGTGETIYPTHWAPLDRDR